MASFSIPNAWLLVISVAAAVFMFGGVADAKSLRKGEGESVKCPLFQFHDTGTGDCEECREVCDHAALLGTQQQCQDSCAGECSTYNLENTLW